MSQSLRGESVSVRDDMLAGMYILNYPKSYLRVFAKNMTVSTRHITQTSKCNCRVAGILEPVDERKQSIISPYYIYWEKGVSHLLDFHCHFVRQADETAQCGMGCFRDSRAVEKKPAYD